MPDDEELCKNNFGTRTRIVMNITKYSRTPELQNLWEMEDFVTLKLP